MEPTIQHKLTNIEIEPPHGLWELLSVRLDAEYLPSEIRLAQRMNDAVLMPPADSWAAIEANLPMRSQEESIPLQRKEPAKLFSIPVRKIAVAVVALIVISFAGWLLFLQPHKARRKAGTKPRRPVPSPPRPLFHPVPVIHVACLLLSHSRFPLYKGHCL